MDDHKEQNSSAPVTWDEPTTDALIAAAYEDA